MRPKPMVEIGGKPMLWHIMKIYAAHGIDDFVICLGYKGYLIKEYFANYYLHTCDVHVRPGQRRHGGPPLRDRAVARDAGRHGRADDDGRTAQARAAVRRRRGLLLHLRRRRRRRRHHGARRVPSRAGDDRDGDRRAAARPLRRAGRRGRPRARVRGEAARRRRLDQRRLLRALAGRRPLHRRATTTVWEQSPMRSLARDGQLVVLPPRGLLAGDGHAARRNHLEELWSSGRPPWRTWT